MAEAVHIAPRPITPAFFQPTPPPGAAVLARGTAYTNGPLVFMLMLIAAAVGLLFMLPRWAPPAVVATMASRTPPQIVNSAEPVLVPPDDAQLTAIARKTAQTLLRASLARVAELQTLQVEQWDRAGLHHVQEHISAGEKAYREQRFRAALDAYRAALATAARLEARLPAVLSALLQAGDTALEQGNSASAAAAFSQVLAIHPNQAHATLGRARAATLDRVQALVEQAEAYEQMGEHDQARAVYDDATRLDSQASRVAAGLARLDKIANKKRLRTALSQGHVALEHGDFAAARLAFKRAAALDAGASEAPQGLRETERRATAAAIAAHLQRATHAVRSEVWREAAREFDGALTLDKELGAARDGKHEAEQRAQLDAQLTSLSHDMPALTDDRQWARAERVLANTQAITQPGPRLRGQIAALRTALRVAREALNVTLVSDGQSDVSIDGVGALGHFTTHVVKLAPGRYRATSRHDGQADVRIEFTIAPGAAAPRITLQSTP